MLQHQNYRRKKKTLKCGWGPVTSLSIMGISISPSDGTGTPTVTTLKKKSRAVRCYKAARDLSVLPHMPVLQLTSISSAPGCACSGSGCAPLRLRSWPAGEFPLSPSRDPGRGSAERQSLLSSRPSIWREQEVRRRWKWPQSPLGDNNERKRALNQAQVSKPHYNNLHLIINTHRLTDSTVVMESLRIWSKS